MDVSIDDLARLIAEELEAYSDDVQEKVEATIDTLAEEIKVSLESNKNIPEKTGKYVRSFYVVNEFKARGKNKGFYKLKVANRKYQLTHLLEFGHAKRGGGRTREFRHWDAAQKLADTLPERIEEAIRSDTG